jgi:hypothetical protein
LNVVLVNIVNEPVDGIRSIETDGHSTRQSARRVPRLARLAIAYRIAELYNGFWSMSGNVRVNLMASTSPSSWFVSSNETRRDRRQCVWPRSTGEQQGVQLNSIVAYAKPWRPEESLGLFALAVLNEREREVMRDILTAVSKRGLVDDIL